MKSDYLVKNYVPNLCIQKELSNKINELVAEIYGLAEKELDYINNYLYKY